MRCVRAACTRFEIGTIAPRRFLIQPRLRRLSVTPISTIGLEISQEPCAAVDRDSNNQRVQDEVKRGGVRE